MKWYWIVILVLLFLARFYISTLSYNPDMDNHFAWVKSLQEQGFAGFYERDFSPRAGANYPPLINEAFYFAQEISNNLNIQTSEVTFSLYKIPAVLFETIAFVLIGALISPILLVVLLINPGIFYNTLLWGQTEGLMAAFIVFSIFFSWKKKVYLSWLMFVLGLLFKQSALVYAPLILLFNLKAFKLKQNIWPIVISVIIFALAFIPFYGTKFISGAYNFIVLQTGGHETWGSVNALNLWFLAGKNQVSDSTLLSFFSYRQISLVVTFGFYVYVLYLAYKSKLNLSKQLIFAGFISFIVFLFMTRVHERHFLPTLILISPVILLGIDRLIAYAVVSFIGFYNMYLIWNGKFFEARFNFLALLSALMLAGFAYLLFKQQLDLVKERQK